MNLNSAHHPRKDSTMQPINLASTAHDVAHRASGLSGQIERHANVAELGGDIRRSLRLRSYQHTVAELTDLGRRADWLTPEDLCAELNRAEDVIRCAREVIAA